MEYLLYGIRKGNTERWQEELLKTGLTSPAAAEPIIQLATKDGFHSFRVAQFDGGAPDFTKILNRR